MKVYLDNNIFIYLENEQLSLKDIENLVDGKISKILFSASHIQETIGIKGSTEQERKKRIIVRLKTIEKITKSNYIHENLKHEISEYKTKPSEVFQTISAVSYTQSIMKSFMNTVSEEQKIQIRRQLGLDPSKLNNYKPEEVVEHLSRKLSEYDSSLSFLGMIEHSIKLHPDGKSFGRTNFIAGIFEMLDMLGYWKDEYNEKSNYARLWDSSHTSFASYCSYFITDDRRTRNKAKVVYDIYGITTKVISSKGE